MERERTNRDDRRLELGEDLRFQRRTWVVQRIGWVMMALVVMMGLGGVFGSGPLSRAAIEDPSGFRVEYERFGRVDAAFELRLDAPAREARDDMLRVAIDDRYLDAVTIEHIMPEPEAVQIDSGRVVFLFRVAEPDGPRRVTFLMKPENPGWLEGQVSAGDGAALPVRHFIYP